MQITKVTVFFLAAMGVISSPIELKSNDLEVRDQAAALRDFSGKCTKSNNTCKYKDDRGKTVIRKCNSKFANDRCFKDGNSCKVDTYSGITKCS